MLAVAGAAVIGLRRSSAAARHLVWFLAVLALLALPLLSWCLPSWNILPNWAEARAVQKAAPVQVKPPVEIAPSQPQIAATVPSINESELNRQEVQGTSAVNHTATETRGPAAVTIQTVTPPRASFDYRHFATLTWVVGAGLSLLPVLLGFLSLWLLERKSRRETGPSWLELLRQLMARLKLRRPVALLKTAHRRMPMTWGFLRPRLLLPEESQDWPEERRRVVMLHELAHARRRDYLTNLITQLACALYWFNPLVWLAARRMATERERACDDIVLGQGAQPADYAEQILEIAAGLPLGRLAAYGGIPMARPSKLEGRLVAILDAKRNRAALTRFAVLAMLTPLAIVVVPVAMMKAASTGAQDATQTQVVFWQAFVDKATAEKLFPVQFAALPTNSFKPIILEGSAWFEVLQAAQREGTLEPAVETEWLVPKSERPNLQILNKISDLPTEERGGMKRLFSQFMVNGFYTLGATDQGADLDLKFGLMSTYQQQKYDQNRFISHSGGTNSGQREIKWHGIIADGQALVFPAKLSGDLDHELYQVAIFQAVSAPSALAPALRGTTSEARWLANGPDGALAEIRAAGAWEIDSLAAATNGMAAAAKYQSPIGTQVRIVAIGQPGRWPMRWWNLDGQAVKAYPGWQQFGGNMGLGVVLNLGRREGTVDCELRLLDDPKPQLTSSSASSSDFGPGDSAYYLGSQPPEQLAQYFDRGGRLELIIRSGVGEWQQIGTIHEDETNETDGGRFVLAKLQPSAGGNQVLLDGHFDYDRAYEIAFAAVNKAGKCSPIAAMSGSGQFSQSTNRRVYNFTEISKDGVDHFAILKRPVKEFVFTNLPTSPRVPITNSPSAANESTPRENASGEATLSAQLAVAAEPGNRVSYAAGFVPEKSEITVGEPIYLTFNLTNTGNRPLLLGVGGQQWGLAGPYRIHAVDARGDGVPDPYSNNILGGGAMGMTAIKPGGVFSDRLYLPTFVKFEKPGEYTVTASRALPGFEGQTIPTNLTSHSAIFSRDGMNWVNTLDDFNPFGTNNTGPGVTITNQPNTGPGIRITNRFRLTVLPADKDRLFKRAQELVARLDGIGVEDIPADQDAPKAFTFSTDWEATTKAWWLGVSNEDLRWIMREVTEIGDPRIIPELKKHLADPSIKVRFACVKALCALGEPLRADWIVPIIKSGHWNINDDPETFAKKHGGSNAASILIACLDMSNPSVSDLWNYRLLNILGKSDIPELDYRYNHDEKKAGTPQQVAENVATLKKLQSWLDAHPLPLVKNSLSAANERTPRESASGGEATLRSQLAEQAARTNATAVIQTNLPAATTPQSLEFMPEIERVLRSTGALGERCYLGFENGVATTERTADNPQRNRQLHRDLKAELTPGSEQWTGIGLQVTPTTDDLWNAPAEKVIGTLADHLAEAPPALPVTRAAWLFKTAEGNYGLMRVEGMVDTPGGGRGMKIVYKLARATARPTMVFTPAAEKLKIRETKVAAKNLPLPERIKQYVAGEPSSTGYALEIWEQGPGSEMRLRDDLVKLPIPAGNVTRGGPNISNGWIYYVPAKNRFYIQWDGLGAGTLHYYGPFEGDPVQVLGLNGPNAAPKSANTDKPGWGEATNGLRSRIVIEAPVLRAGQPIPVHLEIENVSGETKSYSGPTLPYNDPFIVLDAQGKEAPYIGGLTQANVPGPTKIEPGRSNVFKSLNLADSYYLRVPGKYTVKWHGEPAFGSPQTQPTLTSLPPSTEVRFEVVPDAAATADGDPVGRLLPLLKDKWWLSATDAKATRVRPGGNFQQVSGQYFALQYNPTSYKVDSGVVWLWLTDEPAAKEAIPYNWPPPSEYLGKLSRWHVYFNMDSNAAKAWPTAREDTKRVLSAETDPKTPR